MVNQTILISIQNYTIQRNAQAEQISVHGQPIEGTQ